VRAVEEDTMHGRSGGTPRRRRLAVLAAAVATSALLATAACGAGEPAAPPTRTAGLDVFGTVQDEIADVIGSGGDADLLALHYWTALHGIVTLRTVRRGFPWPDVTNQVDDLVDRLVGHAAVLARAILHATVDLDDEVADADVAQHHPGHL
jgi:hypothetical protein